MEFYERLRELREARGLSQRQLTVLAGLSATTVCHLEAGMGQPKLSTVEALARALGVTAAELAGWT